ncbi:MAG: hypothetical protein CMA40_00025 [Euryarchaeota archaeon]|nr:hypothetical protein [Euryarchaeota archaeon]
MNNFFDKYPLPYPYNVKERIDNGLRLPFDLKDEFKFIFPDTKKKKPNVLIVGCGFNEAIYHSLRNPKINFTAIDISSSVIDANNKQIQDYSIKNLNLINVNIMDFSDGDFDIIICSNFLSYQEDSLSFLIKLKSLLNKQGVIISDVLSSIYNDEIEKLYSSFKSIGYSFDNENDINDALTVIKSLDTFHPARLSLLKVTKGQFSLDDFIDINDFVLRYLIPIKKTFSVQSLFKLFKDADLNFQNWYDNSLYYPSINLSESFVPSFVNKLRELPIIDQWNIICALKGPYKEHYKHSFCLTNQDNIVVEPNFDCDDTFVSLRPYQNINTIPESTNKYILRANFNKLLSKEEELICDYLGDKNIKLNKLINDKKLLDQIDNLEDNLKKLFECSVIFFHKNY